MHLLLIRHGESTNNAILHHQKIENEEEFRKLKEQNPELTFKGRKQAYYTGTFLRTKLADCKVDLACSQLQRAQQTAQLAFPNEQCTTYAMFNEWDKGHETLQDIQERIEDAVAFFQAKAKFHANSDTTLIVFGHSLFFSLLISRIISGQRSSSLAVEFPNCSITNLHIDPAIEHIAVYQMGKVDHLGAAPFSLATAVHTVYGC